MMFQRKSVLLGRSVVQVQRLGGVLLCMHGLVLVAPE